MQDNFPNTPLTWLEYLNPNAEIAPGVIVKTCATWCPKRRDDPNNRNIACGYELAYGAAKFILQGSNPNSEGAELRRFLKTYVGKQIVSLDANLERLESGGLDSFVDSIIELGTKLADAAKYFSEHSRAFTPEVVEDLPPDQREATLRIYDVNKRINQLRCGDNPQPLITEMQDALKHAIDVGLHEYGLIIRHSVAYGVGNYLRERLPNSPVAGYLESVIH
jgi:hypothetical protein